ARSAVARAEAPRRRGRRRRWRRRRRRGVNAAFLVIDKPEGITSHDVVAAVRAVTGIKKVGHTGTLDPFATGVLPLALGAATRLTNYFLSSDKVYRGAMRFGFATDTFDIDGERTSEETSPPLERARLEEIFARYVGTVE